MSSVEPKKVINVAVMPGATDSDKVDAAIDTAQNHVSNTQGLSIIYFPTGTYYLSSTIELAPNDSNIVFQGAGSDLTILEFQYIKDLDCFDIRGYAGDWFDLDQNFNKGDSIIHTPSGGLSSISPGDWVHLFQYQFDYNPRPGTQFEKDIVGQITRLETKGSDATGDWGEIKDVANMNYIDSQDTEYSLKVRKVTPVQNIGIENLTIRRYPSDQATDADSIQPHSINIVFAINCWVKGVESYKASRNHLNIAYSSHIEVSGCYIHEAEHYGDGGWGYGVTTYASTTNCLIENNIFRKLRHAMVAGGGSNCNVWAFNYSREKENSARDLDLHAKYPFGHLFEHNIIQVMASDDYHGNNGPYNAFVRNYAYNGNADFRTMEYWSTLGNIRSISPFKVLFHFYDEPPIMDRFGYWSDYTIYRTHNVAYQRDDGDVAELFDVSYYYSERPDFLFPEYLYTWPAIGPKVSGETITQTNPAADRFGTSKKTYLADPTPKPLSTSGTLPYDQIWPNGHALTGNVLIPDNTFILIKDGATINLNGYNIAHLGTGHIIREGAATFLPYDVRLKNGSTITGQYSSIYLALTHSIAGQEVVELAPAAYTFNSNLTIASGKTLRPLAGTTLNFNGNYKLRVEGTLTADGTSSNKITFTRSSGAWYGIEFWNAAYGSRVSWAIINNAQYGIFMYNTNVALEDNSIKYNTTGLRFDNQSEAAGIVRGNVVSENNYAGIECTQYSDPLLFSGNVVRYNNFYGVYGDNTSAPDLGRYSDQGYNSIYLNSDDIWSNYPGTIYARYNWWGEYPAEATVSYNVDYSNALNFDPNPGMGKRLAGDPSNKDSENQLSGASEADTLGMAEIDLAYKIFLGGEYDEALSRFEGIVGKYPDHFSSRRALIFVTRCLDRLNRRNESLSRVTQLVQNFTGKEVFGLAQSLAVGELIKSGQYAEAVAQSEEIVNNFPGTTLAKYALYDLGSIHWYRLEDEKAGENYFRQLIAAWPEDDLTISALATLGEWKPAQGKGSQPASAPLKSVPSTYALAQNFPNPFNPQTKILYQLPEPGRVSLKIYDLLGKEVRTLVEEFREAGYHHVIWDGRDNADRTVPSGVYLCKLTANGFVQTKKMALIK